MAADGNGAPEQVSEAQEHDDIDEALTLLDPGARLDAALERDLRWFLGDPPIAGLVADSGGFGGQLERAAAYGYGALPCRRCGGSWRQARRSSDGELVITEWRDGTGWLPSTRFFPPGVAQSYRRALAAFRERQVKELRLIVVGDGGNPAVNEEARALFAEIAPGQRMVTRAELAAMFPSVPSELCKPCEACQGLGVVPRRTHKKLEVTARPTGSSVGKAGRHPDSMATVAWDDFMRYRGVERVLEHVATTSPLHRIVLATYYAPVELIPGEGGPAGAFGFDGVWPLTPTARTWLDDSGFRRPLHGELAAIRARAGSADSAAWLKAIRREAWGLYGAACVNANAAARATGWEAA